MVIRLLEKKDISAWVQMRNELWQDADIEQLSQEAESIFLHLAKNPVFVAEITGSQLVGFLEVGLREYVDGCDTSPVAYIEGMYVKAGFRQQGVVNQLVMEAKKWAKSIHCQELASDTELENELSQLVHQKLGFEEVSRLVIFRQFL